MFFRKKATALIAAFLFAACGDTVENIYQTGTEVVSSVGDLPKCTADKNGAQAYVKGETSARICVDGEWYALKSDDGSASAVDFSCKTEELKDRSGLKIICNGDSIGVVLNGAAGKDGQKGEDGKAGSGCSISGKTDSTVTVACGDSTMVLELGSEMDHSVLEPDSERIAVSLDSLAGYSQKGPFLKGSTVYLYELSDGRTLKQTNGNFTSIITRDDGRYKFTARDLASQYAMIVVDGNYRNEVTGEPSTYSIRLRALTDMRKRSEANVNLLTHMEFDRVYYLVTREHKTVKQAKKQAQAEIFNAFHIDTTGFSGSSEDLDVFGTTDADAALLAISVLLQGTRSENELMILLTEVSNAMETGGTWDGGYADTVKAAMADWALEVDTSKKFDVIKDGILKWNISPTVPNFEVPLRKYWSVESKLGVCGEGDNVEGTVKSVSNAISKYYASTYTDIGRSVVRFICDNGKWRIATDFEKDTYERKCSASEEGSVLSGRINYTTKYYCMSDSWVDIMDWSWDIPKSARLNPNVRYDSIVDARDGRTYKTIKIGSQTWMAENLNYADTTETFKINSKCLYDKDEYCEIAGRRYSWSAVIDSVKLESDSIASQLCGDGKTCSLSTDVAGICPEGWRVPSKADWETLIAAAGGKQYAGERLMSKNGWSHYTYGTDWYGFSGFSAGSQFAYFASSTEYDGTTAYCLKLGKEYNHFAYMDKCLKNGRLPIRCVKD